MRNDAATVLLTLGRLPAALEIARAFAARGYRVVVAEPFACPLCRLSNSVDKCYRVTSPVVDTDAYQAELVSIISAEKVSLVIPVSEETLFVSALQLPESVQLLCMNQDSLLQLHDKYRFACWAAGHNLPVPETSLADDKAVLQSNDYVVKPRLSCSGIGVHYYRAGEELPKHLQSSTNLVQQKLSGSSCSSFTLAVSGSALTTVCYQSLLQSGSVAVCFEQLEVPAQIVQFIAKVVNLLQYTGMISFDFMQSATGQWQAIECNPRATSGIHFVDADTLVDAFTTHAVNREVSVKPNVRRQEFWSSLARVEGDLLKRQWNTQGWRYLFSTRDITWSSKDIKPFIFMPLVLAPQLWQALKNKQPVSELLMLDVGWYR